MPPPAAAEPNCRPDRRSGHGPAGWFCMPPACRRSGHVMALRSRSAPKGQGGTTSSPSGGTRRHGHLHMHGTTGWDAARWEAHARARHTSVPWRRSGVCVCGMFPAGASSRETSGTWPRRRRDKAGPEDKAPRQCRPSHQRLPVTPPPRLPARARARQTPCSRCHVSGPHAGATRPGGNTAMRPCDHATMQPCDHAAMRQTVCAVC